VLTRCDGLFTHAEALAKRLARDYPGLPRAAHPLPATAAGPLLDRAVARQSLGLPAGGRVAVFAGLIRPYKGVDLLLEAFARLPAESDWRLVVAGEAWSGHGRQLRQRAAKPDLAWRSVSSCGGSRRRSCGSCSPPPTSWCFPTATARSRRWRRWCSPPVCRC